jgi:hypothetical protein
MNAITTTATVAPSREGVRAHRAELKRKLDELRAKLDAALAERKARMRQLKDLFRTERAELRERIKQKRADEHQKIRHESRAAMKEADLSRQARLAEARQAADSEIAAARAALKIEEQHRARQRTIASEQVRRHDQVEKEHAKAVASGQIVSSGQLGAAVLGHYGPLFQHFATKAKPIVGETPHEAVLRHAEQHPAEAHAVLEPKAERAIAKTQEEVAAAERALERGPTAVEAERALRREQAAEGEPSGANRRPGSSGETANVPPPRRKGQVPKHGGGILVADLLRERDELAAEREKRAAVRAGAAKVVEAKSSKAPRLRIVRGGLGGAKEASTGPKEAVFGVHWTKPDGSQGWLRRPLAGRPVFVAIRADAEHRARGLQENSGAGWRYEVRPYDGEIPSPPPMKPAKSATTKPAKSTPARTANPTGPKRAAKPSPSESPAFADALRRFMALVERNLNASRERLVPGSSPLTLTAEPGPRYVRIVKTEGGSRSVYGFIDTTNGNLLHAESWKKPKKRPSGNIYKTLETRGAK